MKRSIALLLIVFVLCSWCRRIINSDYYYKKDKEVFDAHLHQHQPEYKILCPSCYRQIIYKENYYKENINDETAGFFNDWRK